MHLRPPPVRSRMRVVDGDLPFHASHLAHQLTSTHAARCVNRVGDALGDVLGDVMCVEDATADRSARRLLGHDPLR